MTEIFSTLSGVPKYLVIAEDLRKKILEGFYPAGSYLPTEPELQKVYQVSRPTIRASIARLREMGMVEVDHGRGTRVKNQQIYQWLDNQLSFTEVIQSQGFKPGTIVLEAKYVTATPMVAESLNIPRGSRVFKIGRIRTANDSVISYHLSYLLEDYPINKEKLEQNFSLYRYLEESYGVVIVFTDDVISSEPASSGVARLLGIKTGDPILILNRIAYAANDQVVELALSYIRSDRFKYKTRIYRKGQFKI